MSISRWEPFREMLTLRQAMDRLFDESFVRPGRAVEGTGALLPLDIFATKDAVIIHASVPGANPDDVQVSIEGSTVTIRGEAQVPQVEGEFLLQERRHGPFSRAIDLGMPVQADKAEADFENGVLTLTIPKAEEIKPKVIKVKTR